MKFGEFLRCDARKQAQYILSGLVHSCLKDADATSGMEITFQQILDTQDDGALAMSYDFDNETIFLSWEKPDTTTPEPKVIRPRILE